MVLLRLIKKMIYPHTYDQNAYRKYLRNKGVIIGDHTAIYSPNRVSIDTRKPWLIKIGDYCSITSGVHILAHDYSVSVPRKCFGEFVGGSSPVTIGDNVFIGVNAIILKGTQIGNNSIVGAGAVVKGNFPDNVVIVGNPAKVVCTIEDFYIKNKERWIEDAKIVAKRIFENSGHIPTIEEMSDGYFWLYMPRDEETINQYRAFFKLSADDYENIKMSYFKSKPVYRSFEEFLEDCNFDIS